MDVRKILYLSSDGVRYVLLFIVSVVLVAWQYFGMELQLDVVPQVSSKLQPRIHSDHINGGISITELSVESGRIRLDCDIVLSNTFAFCGVSIPLVAEGESGIDIRRYSEMVIEIDFRSAQYDTLLIYMINSERAGQDGMIDKSMLWPVSPAIGPNRFQLSTHRFFVPSWWIYQNSSDGQNYDPDISNVTALQITSGDNTEARKFGVTINRITFRGKWISADDLYLGLLIAWLALIFFHGLRYMYVLSERFRESKEQNIQLLEINRFLSIQKDQFETMAKQDKLTGAWNRAGLRDKLTAVLDEYRKSRVPCALLILDLDDFKSINDEYGHAAGDDVLKAFVSLISSHTRSQDWVARWGGEEFVLICPQTDLSSAVQIARMLVGKVETTRLLPGRKVTCSIGVAALRNENIKEWFNRADQALYRAKKAGRNCVKRAD